MKGSGAPRFRDGRVFARRNWKVLDSPYETQFTPYQRKEISEAHEINQKLVEEAKIRREKLRSEQLTRSEQGARKRFTVGLISTEL